MVNAENLASLFKSYFSNRSVKANSNRLINACKRYDKFDITEEDIIRYYVEGTDHQKDLVDTMVQDLWVIKKWLDEHPKSMPAASQPIISAQALASSEIPDMSWAETAGVSELDQMIRSASKYILNTVPEMLVNLEARLMSHIDNNYGPITRAVKVVLPSGEELSGVVDPNFTTVMTWVIADKSTGKSPYLVGPAGTGKSYMCEQIAKALKIPFYSTNAVKDEYKLTGFIDANGNYRETDFYRAWTTGGVFCLDEIDASSPEALIDLNGALASRVYPFPTGAVKAHEDFHFIATANTFGKGANLKYVGRNELDAATLDRFATVFVDYDPQVEESFTKDQEILDFVRAFRTACEKSDFEVIASYRAIRSMEALKESLDDKTVLDSVLTNSLERADLNTIKGYLPPENRYTKALNAIIKSRNDAR